MLIWAFWQDAVRQMGLTYFVTMGVAWVVAGVVAVRREQTRGLGPILCGVGVATFLYGSTMALFFRGVGRHIAPAIPLIVICPLLILARAFPAIADWRALSAGLLVVVVFETGSQSPTRVRQQLLKRLGEGRAEQLYIGGVTVLTGDYWRVWPLAYAINMLHEAHDGRRPVLPVTMRAERLIERRRAEVRAGIRVAVVPSGHLLHWGMAGLPGLHVQADFPGYTLGIVSDTR